MKRFILHDQPMLIELFPSRKLHPYAHEYVQKAIFLNRDSKLILYFLLNVHIDIDVPPNTLIVYFEKPA